MARGFFLAHEQYPNLEPLFSGVIRVPGAVVRFDTVSLVRRQLYFTNEYNHVENILTQLGLDVLYYKNKRDLPWKYLAHMILVERRDTAANNSGNRFKVLADCDATDFLRVRVLAGGTNEFRHYRVAGTAGRWRPNLERLRDVQDRFYFTGDLLANNPFGSGQHDADTGEADRVVDD